MSKLVFGVGFNDKTRPTRIDGKTIQDTWSYLEKKELIEYQKELEIANQRGKMHPTQKPVALMEYLIKTYTNEDEFVLDFTAGSMSTAIACINTNRKGIMIEKDEYYFKVGSDRVSKALQER